MIEDDFSGDELLHETRKQIEAHKLARQRKLSNRTRLRKPAMVVMSTRPAPKVLAAQIAHLDLIDWVFWIQADDEVGYWRPLSDFPNATKVQIKRKFDTDFLQTPRHIRLWRAMLSNQDKYLDRDMCVGNVTYWSRNKPSKWKKAQGDKEKTCDTCFNAGRFCARMVKVGDVVKLGFFPALDVGNTAVGWRKIRHWVRERK